MTTFIKLTQGKWATIDDEDIGLVSAHKWCYAKNKRTNTGYAQASAKTPDGSRHTTITMHQLILGGTSRRNPADHIDGDGLNNRRSNLRVATCQQNAQNQALRKVTVVKYKGVTRNKHGRYVARIVHNYKACHLGVYGTPEKAARAYDEKARELFGEFARTNFDYDK
jgi:hypothetical protein